MKLKTTEVLYRYWNRIREGRPAPRRFDVDPSQISQILDETLILERVDLETFRFRLAGTQIRDIFGLELKGVDFAALWPNPADRVALDCSLSRVVHQCGAARIEFDARDADGRRAAFEMLLLPLFHTGETIDRCIGSIAELPTFETPAFRPLFDARIISEEVLWPEQEVSSPLECARAFQPAVTEQVQSRLVRTKNRDFVVYDGGLGKRQS